ncbi:MAG: hypothetical protein JNL70_24150 [Saprospiraceae bacterium]|nr:hypothetical protein [Saprospiraceae bacterium]
MKIKIKREGGFIGITSKANLEFDDLTIEEQNALNKLAEQSLSANSNTPSVETPKRDLAAEQAEAETRGLILAENNLSANTAVPEKPILKKNAPQETPKTPPNEGIGGMMRDGFNYSISMKKNGKTVSLQFDDMTAPPEIVQIFQKYVQY